jgi:hypothetical protein
VEFALPSDVANGGSFTVPYPTGAGQSGPWSGGSWGAGHVLRDERGNQYTAGTHFTVAFNPSNIGVAWQHGAALPRNTRCWLQLNAA